MTGGVAAVAAEQRFSSQVEKVAMNQGVEASSASSLAGAVAAAASRQIKLTPSDTSAVDGFGVSVSLSGNRALIGASRRDGIGQDSGAAYIFSDGRTWTQEAELIPSDTAQYQSFGQSVSLVGTRALIGAPGDSGAGLYVGAVYLYDLVGSSWVQGAKLTPQNPNTGGYFGRSVSLTGDRALVGAYLANRSKGKAYVYDFDGTAWSQSATLTASDLEQFDEFGVSVSLSGDRALIGTAGAQAAYVFLFDGTN